MNNQKIGILGARSFVGQYILELFKELNQDYVAFSRQKISAQDIQYYPPSIVHLPSHHIPQWISCLPVKNLPLYLSLLTKAKARKIVVISSASVITKLNAPSLKDREFAASLHEAEEKIKSWADESGVEWTILRPTMIYDLKNDRNLRKILNFIQRFGFFPIYGAGEGLRQPIHASEVANACIQALFSEKTCAGIFDISGKEVMHYREMIVRLFNLAEKKPRFITVPPYVLSMMLQIIRLIPSYRNLTISMFERMNQDLSCDHSLAKQTFNFTPNEFLSNNESECRLCELKTRLCER